MVVVCIIDGRKGAIDVEMGQGESESIAVCNYGVAWLCVVRDGV